MKTINDKAVFYIVEGPHGQEPFDNMLNAQIWARVQIAKDPSLAGRLPCRALIGDYIICTF